MDEISVEILTPNLTVVNQDPEINLTLDLNSFHASAIPAYTHLQGSESQNWTINHNLGYKPIVNLYNSGSQLVTGTVTHVSDNQTVVQFTKAISGFARLI